LQQFESETAGPFKKIGSQQFPPITHHSIWISLLCREFEISNSLHFIDWNTYVIIKNTTRSKTRFHIPQIRRALIILNHIRIIWRTFIWKFKFITYINKMFGEFGILQQITEEKLLFSISSINKNFRNVIWTIFWQSMWRKPIHKNGIALINILFIFCT
jgi:hypothetical protein